MKINSEIIKNFLDDYFPNRALNGNEYVFSSPFFADRGKRLYVNKNTGQWFDFHEGFGGDFPSFVSKFLDISYFNACDMLEGNYSVAIPTGHDIRDILFGEENITLDYNVSVSNALDVHPKMFDELEELDDDGEEAIRYLQERKINVSGLGYFPRSDETYSGRIFIPFYENGELVYFLARSYIGSELRYKNPAGLDTDVIFNFDKIIDSVAIFEGSFDAMSVDNIVGTAILSNRMKDGQARKLMSKPCLNKIIFVPDHDPDKNTRKLILSNMILNYQLLNKYKSPSRNVDFFIYDIPEGYKDFNEYKQKTGNGNIDFSDCTKFSESSIRMKIMLTR